MMDPRLSDALDAEKDRQDTTIELIASENFASTAVRDLSGSIFTNKYAEGYPSKRYYNGCENVDTVEQLAIDTAKELFGCEFANVQPHSGANANLAVMNALLKPGDRILGMDLASGGHLSHGSPVNVSGKLYQTAHYGVDPACGWISMKEVERMAMEFKPKLIIAGASAYPRQLRWERFREIADMCGALLMVDMAHYAGLIAGGVYDNPLPYADVVTSTTHKTLRGPRGGIILWNNPDYSKKINSSVFPGTQGGPLMNQIAAKAQCFIEANTDEFKIYSTRVINNAREMCGVFLKHDMNLLTSGTDSHIILLDLSDSNLSGRAAADLLEENGITVNKNGIPNDPRSFIETSGIRIGTAAMTTKGFDSDWFNDLAERIVEILRNG